MASINAGGQVLNAEFATYDGATVVAYKNVVPTSYALHQNYPNPFNPATTIAFDLKDASAYTLTIYNVAGQQVKQFVGRVRPEATRTPGMLPGMPVVCTSTSSKPTTSPTPRRWCC